jgi:hypothetical protein
VLIVLRCQNYHLLRTSANDLLAGAAPVGPPVLNFQHNSTWHGTCQILAAADFTYMVRRRYAEGPVMSTLEERVRVVEAKVEDHSRAMGDLRDLIIALDQKVDRRFESLDHRLESFDRRFESLERRLESFDRRFESVDRRFESLEQRFDSKFNRLITIQLTTLVALVAGLFGTVGALLRL